MKTKNTLAVTAISTSAALLIGLSAAAQADTPSFNFVQIDRILSGEADFGVAPNNAKVDANDGIGLKGSFEIGDLFFVSGETLDVNYEDKLGEFMFPGDAVVVTDSSFVGGGVHFPLADMAELYAEIGLARATFASFAANGYGFKMGARVNVGIAEVGAWYQKSQADFDTNNVTIDYDPEVMGLDVALTFAQDAPQVVLGYSEATYELSASNSPSTDVDTASFSIGVRKTF